MRRRSRILIVSCLLLVAACSAERADVESRPGRIGRQGVLATGSIGDSGETWTLSAEVEGDSLCLDLLGRACIAIPNGHDPLQARLTTTGRDPGGGYACSYGAVSRQVHSVQAHFDDGTETAARLIRGRGWDASFYVACIDRSAAPSGLVLLDRNGEELPLN